MPYVLSRNRVQPAKTLTDLFQRLGCCHLFLFLPRLHPLHDARTQRCRPQLWPLRHQTCHVAQQRPYGRTCAWLGSGALSCRLNMAFCSISIHSPDFLLAQEKWVLASGGCEACYGSWYGECRALNNRVHFSVIYNLQMGPRRRMFAVME